MFWENETHTVLFEVSESTPFRTRRQYGDITTELGKLPPERETAEEVRRLLESWVKCLGVYEPDEKQLLRRARKNRYAFKRSAVVQIYYKPTLDLEKNSVYIAFYGDHKEVWK